ncbi:MAG: PRC-barrel domain-containing protein [Scytolyngbya sp. HA4215-MV1]|jgi:uncharacterized protein YrrD/gas vesicle protein|nr:PRC-barrel domain-containing protein [Scytolyngbya sp. HA4215-MV1]
MSQFPETIRQSELLNQLVLDRNTMEELGRIEVLWMYPQAHRVLGFVCKTGFLSGKKLAFKLSQVTAIGENGILTHGQAEATDAEKVKQLESLINLEVWSDAGNRVGKITDCVFNLQTGLIAHYLFVSSGWSSMVGEVYQLPPGKVQSFGRKRVLVAESAIALFELAQGGIPQKLGKVGEFVKEEVAQDMRSFTKQAQSVTEQAKGRWQNLAGLAKQRAQALSQQAKEKLQAVNEQLREEAETLAQQAREKSEALAQEARKRSELLAEQLKERGQTIGEQMEEGIQTLTVQAREILDPDERSPMTATRMAGKRATDETDPDWEDEDWLEEDIATDEPAPWEDEGWVEANQTTSEVKPPTQPIPTISVDNGEADDFWGDEDETVEPLSAPALTKEPLLTPEVSPMPPEVLASPTDETTILPPMDEWDDEWEDEAPSPVMPQPSVRPQTAPPEEDDDEPWI